MSKTAPPRWVLATNEWLRVAAIAAAVVAMHAIGFALMWIYAGDHRGLAAAGTLAYTLGLRHAFDADHIAAIDNTTRNLRSQGQRPMGVGFFFSLGHASVVFILTLVVVLFTHAVPDLGEGSGIAATSISGVFLWTIGILNLLVLIDIVRVARGVRRGTASEQALETMLVPKGLLSRLGLDRVMRFVGHSWQMYPVGLLFGLGFDTATEVSLLALGAGATASGMPILAILMLPILFTAGMCLMDSLDGILMFHAYDWALRRPVRKLFYNLTITSLSVTVALIVGTVQLINVAIVAMKLKGGAWDWIAGLDFQILGYGMAGIFLGVWIIALIAWRVLDLEARWERRAATAG